MKKTICIIAAAAMLLASLPAIASTGKLPVETTSLWENNEVVLWDFEGENALEGWQFVDADGDGINWDVSSNYALSGSKSLSSYSYLDNVYYTPDNWAITPAVTVPEETCAALTFSGRNHMPTGVDVFRVYAGTTPDISEMSPIAPSMAFSGQEFEQKFIDISAFAGQTIYFAFRHFNSYDIGFIFYIDDVSIITNFEPLAPQPENLLYGCYFNEYEDLDGWQQVDANGDGFGWSITVNPRYTFEGVGVVGSESLVTGPGGGPVEPDNWLISPAVSLPSDELLLSFYAAGIDTMFDAYYLEHFSVYVGTSPELDDMVEIIAETEVSDNFECYTADLSDYANQTVYFAIRHHNCYYQNWLRVDSFEVWGSGEFQPDPTPPSRIYGDVNLNGVVEIEDSLKVMRWLISIEELNEEQLDMAEVQGNGSIALEDSLLIMRYSIGTISTFPRENAIER